MAPQNFGKTLADRKAAAFLGDVLEYLAEITARGGEVDELAHSVAGPGQLPGFGGQLRGQIVVGRRAAGGDGGIQGLG